ncbi:PAP fimbrial minor pilin protein precursor [Serratia proteamaculans]|uniref:fimbrial protein n=1 Tax=Serratia proteamaculans TaxID=28151 RepID=UPI00217B2477|nr:fimbrial protein [Serratia proteamaculans]CAI1624974.1 PAP fimbrial minor pilin protein precursor [Serratia proteamaculans]CAI1658583.1 PAP fimbrial minor pilin protein precursor [Serratia proteamaculans]
MLSFRSSCFVPCLWIACGFAVSLAAIAHQGQGMVNMQGSIVDVPCAIAVSSRDQSIDLAVLPVGQIMRDGQGPVSPFSIQLVNCSLQQMRPGRADWTQFRVTFAGEVTDSALFGISGHAAGVGIQITDVVGNVAQSGVPMPPGALVPGDTRLDYSLRLVGTHQILRAGAYRTTVRFKMDYY